MVNKTDNDNTISIRSRGQPSNAASGDKCQGARTLASSFRSASSRAATSARSSRVSLRCSSCASSHFCTAKAPDYISGRNNPQPRQELKHREERGGSPEVHLAGVAELLAGAALPLLRMGTRGQWLGHGSRRIAKTRWDGRTGSRGEGGAPRRGRGAAAAAAIAPPSRPPWRPRRRGRDGQRARRLGSPAEPKMIQRFAPARALGSGLWQR